MRRSFAFVPEMRARAKAAKRGRPPKFGRRGQVIAVTLPAQVVRGLRKVHPDLGWAIVNLFEKTPRRPQRPGRSHNDAELMTIAVRRSLIVVNRKVFHNLPGVNIIPLNDSHALLALEVGRGMSDLELAVIDRLRAPSIETRERRALEGFQVQLRQWRRDRTLRCEMRSIIVLERLNASRPLRART